MSTTQAEARPRPAAKLAVMLSATFRVSCSAAATRDARALPPDFAYPECGRTTTGRTRQRPKGVAEGVAAEPENCQRPSEEGL